MSFPSPLLHIPTRSTDEADFSEPFSDYISVAYEQDSSKFKHEIATLNRLRQDVRGAGKDLTGRDILYRYYGQLELLDLRFPFDETHVQMAFSWKDSFTGEECSQYSIAFEKASVIYNLGAICSSIAALQNRFEAEGLRMAFNYFQASAGLFSFINENFLHAPSVDMSRDSIKTLTELALAQAQECFLEKVTVVEKKKGNLASKLSAQLSFMYMNVLDGLSLEYISGQFEKAWLDLIRIKSKLFAALAHYHRHLQYEMDNQYGLSVSHIMVAETYIKEAHKLAEKFAYNFPNFNISSQSNETSTTGKSPSSASTALLEITKMDLKMISDKLVIAKRDNDMIYHDSIPPVDSLAPLEKLNAVKAIPFADLLPNGQADIPKIVGNDIFAKLIPMSVHESSSVYSEEKSKLYRSQQKLVKQTDDEIDATLNSLNLREIMDQIKSIYNNPNNINGEILSAEVMEWCVRVQENEMKSSKFRTEDLLKIINSLKPSIEEMLSEIPALLDKEQLDCENMRVKYMDSWTQEPSASLTSTMRNEFRAHKESYQKAVPLDGPIVKELDDSKNIISILNRPVDKLETYLVHCIVSAVPFQEKDSLLDENAAKKDDAKIGLLGEQISIEKIDSLIQHLQSLKKDRSSILDEIREKIKKDDISSLLLLNKGKEKQIFQSELTKYAELQTKISSNMDSHKQFLDDLVIEFKKLASSSKALSVNDARIQEKLKIFQDWKGQYQRYKIAKDGLRKGRVFYTDLKSSLDELKSKVVQFVNQRNAERVNLEKKIEAEFAESGQRAMKEQLQKLSIQSPTGLLGPQAVPYSTPAVSYNAAPVRHHAPITEQRLSTQQFPRYPNANHQAHLNSSPSAPEISPQNVEQGSRTPIPPMRLNRCSSFSRESSGLEVDHSPTSNPVANYPRATFDAQQFHALASRQQSFSGSMSNQGDSPAASRELHHAEHSEKYISHGVTIQGTVQDYRPAEPIQSSITDRGYLNQSNSGIAQSYLPGNDGLGQEYRPSQEYRPAQGYRPSQEYRPAQGYRPSQEYRPAQEYRPSQAHRPSQVYAPSQAGVPPQTNYQPPPGVLPTHEYRPAHLAQGYKNPEHRPNPVDLGTVFYRPQIRSDIYSSRPGYSPQNLQTGNPYTSINQPAQHYRAPNQQPVSNLPSRGGGYPSGPEYQGHRPMPSQGYGSYQGPESAHPSQTGQGYSGHPYLPNQGYGYPGANNISVSGYIHTDRPPTQGYRPPLNVMYAQQGQPQNQRPQISQVNEYGQYSPSQQNRTYPGQNQRGSLMD